MERRRLAAEESRYATAGRHTQAGADQAAEEHLHSSLEAHRILTNTEKHHTWTDHNLAAVTAVAILSSAEAAVAAWTAEQEIH